MAILSRMLRFSSQSHEPDPRSLATTYGVSVDVLSSGYLDVSVPRVRLQTPIYSEPAYSDKFLPDLRLQSIRRH